MESMVGTIVIFQAISIKLSIKASIKISIETTEGLADSRPSGQMNRQGGGGDNSDSCSCS